MASFYVDNAILSSDDGTSWLSAWKNFSDIDWSLIKPGDTLHISGGGSSRTYQETLTVGASGSAGSPITITVGTDPGHGGMVIIDGENTRANGVLVDGHHDVDINHLSIRNHAGAGVQVRDATAGVVIAGNDILSGDSGSGTPRGIDVNNSSGVAVSGNSLSTPTNTSAQTDGIWSSDNDGVVFENNRIVISNSNPVGHSDGIQSYLDHNIIIRNNWIEQENTATTDNHGLWLSNTRDGGVIEVYNNVILTPNLTDDSAVTHWAEPSWDETGTVKLWANTVYGGARSLNLDRSPNAEVQNNIFWPTSGGAAIHVLNGDIPAANIQNNLIWAPDATVASINESPLTWSSWQGLGYDRNGVNADPSFTDLSAEDLTLTPASPAIDQGATLTQVATDQAGTARPQGAGYDIGAYETTEPSGAPAARTAATGMGKGLSNASGLMDDAGIDPLNDGTSGDLARLTGDDSVDTEPPEGVQTTDLTLDGFTQDYAFL